MPKSYQNTIFLYISFICLSLISANYLNSYFPMSVTAVPPIAEAIPSSLSDSYTDLLKRHYSFLNLPVPVTDSMLLHAILESPIS